MERKLLTHIAKMLGVVTASYVSLWLFTFGNINSVGFLVACCLVGAIDLGMWIDKNMPKHKV